MKDIIPKSERRKIELRHGQLTWHPLFVEEVSICSCGSDKFFFLKTRMGSDLPEEYNSMAIRCCRCGARYLVG